VRSSPASSAVALRAVHSAITAATTIGGELAFEGDQPMPGLRVCSLAPTRDVRDTSHVCARVVVMDEDDLDQLRVR
jgi:hypothetical protein